MLAISVNCYFPANVCLDEDAWIRLPSSSLVDVLIKTNISPLSHISLEEVFKKSWLRQYTFALVIRFQDIFKTFSRRLKKFCKNVFRTSSRRLQSVFKTSSRHFQDILQRCHQDVFKTYHQVKLFLLTHLEDIFEMYSKRFWDVLPRQLFAEGFT